MPLSEEQLNALRGDAFADDVSIDVAKMSLWTEEQAKEYFLSGGKVEPSASVTDVSDSSQAQSADLEAKVQALKGHGNEKLKGKDYEGAAIAYKEAIALCTPAMSETAGAIHSNLSMAQMKLEDPTAALVSAESCVQCRPKWEKGFFRKGEALFALRRYDEAAASYGSGLECKPGDADLSFSLKLAKEAAKGGVWFRQLMPGRDIAISPPSSQVEGLIFGAAKQMRNFIYLVGCATTREVYCFDPAWDTRGIAAVCERHKMKLVGAMGTHYHFDHVGGAVPPQFAPMLFGPFGGSLPGGEEPRMSGLREMKTDYGARLYAQSVEVSRIAKQIGVLADHIEPLKQGSVLPLGASGQMEILHTPGHSAGSICIRVQPSSGAAEAFILSGDCIFPGSCGRLDLPDSNKDEMFESLAKLRALDDKIRVYPGHGYSGDSTTIGQEKVQGLLRPFDKATFKSMMG